VIRYVLSIRSSSSGRSSCRFRFRSDEAELTDETSRDLDHGAAIFKFLELLVFYPETGPQRLRTSFIFKVGLLVLTAIDCSYLLTNISLQFQDIFSPSSGRVRYLLLPHAIDSTQEMFFVAERQTRVYFSRQLFMRS